MADHKQLIVKLLKGIETGDPASVAVVNEAQYIQHNPQTHEGSEGLAALFKRLSKTSPRVKVVRIFEDRDLVFGHTEYEFASSRIGFEVFRFENGQAVEHWDNIQPRRGPNRSGRSMVDGSVEPDSDADTEANRARAKAFVDEVLIKKHWDQLQQYVDAALVEHHPDSMDGLPALGDHLQRRYGEGSLGIDYQRRHRVLADHDFVLTVCEGYRDGVHTSFYDLFRLAEGRIVEHWDTTESVPPRDQWKNDNGKF